MAKTTPEPTDKKKALNDVLSSIEPLDRKDQADVLRAAANFYGLKVPMETV